ncbi:MAG: Clp protease N-terminal domain-containing protein [Vampirovibrionales bacterium]
MIDSSRLTNQMQQVLQNCQRILQRYEQTQLDNEHLLLGMLEDRKGLAVKILSKLNVDVPAFIGDLESAVSRRSRGSVNAVQSGQVFLTPRLGQLFDRAGQEAERMKDSYISAEHVMIALADSDGDSGQLFKRF